MLKFTCALLVVFGLVLSVIPVIFKMDKDSANDDDWKKQSTVGRILWPLCFMVGFVSYSDSYIDCDTKKCIYTRHKINLSQAIIH